MQRRIAVTGATGFVGPHLMAALARRGWSLRLLVRRWSPLPPMAGVDAEIVWGQGPWDVGGTAIVKRDSAPHSEMQRQRAARETMPLMAD